MSTGDSPCACSELDSFNGIIEAQHGKGRRVIGLLRYAKRESLDLLHWMDVLRPRTFRPLRASGPKPSHSSSGCVKIMRAVRAGVEKLAYSWRSKRHARKGLGVRLPSPAPLLDNLLRTPVG